MAEGARARAGRGLKAVRVFLVAVVAATAVVAAFAQPAAASRYLRVGIFDNALTAFDTTSAFAYYKQLHVQEIRLNLFWGGPYGVAKTRPRHATHPDDPAYDWSQYDRVVTQAHEDGIRVLFSIYGTPSWANGGKGLNVAPTRGTDLRNFALAAAIRYGGTWRGADGSALPAVREWLAWNEPNNPVFLKPQWQRTARGWSIASAVAYARICNSVYSGVHAANVSAERVACGATAPRGNNNPRSSRPSVSPIAFLRAVKKAGLKSFDAWAHHPYYGAPNETPTTRPTSLNGDGPTAVTLGNLNDLIKVVTQLYGNKRIWITEYGYQTNPPDRLFGVSLAKQAAYLTQAFAIARKNPRIDLMLWFLLKDEPSLGGWQSGLLTATGRKKPSFAAFMRMAAGTG